MTLRVFIVDDDRDHAESIADVLTMRGFQTELAFSGEAGPMPDRIRKTGDCSAPAVTIAPVVAKNE